MLRRSTIALLATSGALLLGFAVSGTGSRGAAPVRVEVGGSGPSVSIAWTGDTMLGDAAQQLLEEDGYDWPLRDVAPLLQAADVAIVNAEAPITNVDDPFTPTKLYSYRTDPQVADALAEAGVSVLGLANNHAMDQGELGLVDTLDHADRVGLVAFGAGRDEREAERPLIIDAPGVRIGVVGLAKGYGGRLTARPGQAGTLPLSLPTITRGERLARRAGAHVVVAYVHWGENYRTAVHPDQRRDARRLIDAGYDLIIGHGPHVVQEAELIEGRLVFYSLGNFVFGTPGSFSEELPGVGLVLHTDLDREGLVRASVTCLNVDNRVVDYRPTPCDTTIGAKTIAGLGLGLVGDGAVGHFEATGEERL
jgi:poly-gamma-glutamate capsule biosynthesis protein CapA/YwtB (metallophosphatase superfamily)